MMADQQSDRSERRKFRNPEAIARLKGFERESIKSSSAQAKQSPLPPVQGASIEKSHSDAEDDWRPQENDEEGDNPFQAAEADKRAAEARYRVEAEKVIAVSNKQEKEKEKNKENLDQHMVTASGRSKPPSLMDRQESAERVPWDDSQPSNQERGVTQKAEKRAQATDEDEDFQQDNRTANVRERRTKATTAQSRTTKPVRKPPLRQTRPPAYSPPADEEDEETGQEEDEETGQEEEVFQRQIRSEVDRSTFGGSQAPSGSQAEIAEQQKRINQLAKDRVRAGAPAKVQTRRPWSDVETSALIEYIMEHGTSYAFIKKLDETDQKFLKGRDQIALKDKARNIKTDYLKARKELPPNFDKIPLNKGLKDKLNAIGVVYNDQTGLADYEDQ